MAVREEFAHLFGESPLSHARDEAEIASVHRDEWKFRLWYREFGHSGKSSSKGAQNPVMKNPA